jgi:ferredoxin
MPDITLKPADETVSVAKGANLLDVLVGKDCQVMMACGRQGICATCHVHVQQGSGSLSPKQDREARTLELITGANETSRLSCQVTVTGDEPIELLLPEGLYVESFADLESLVGKRTQVPILHPVDGRILIQKGKIITRSMIMQLADTDFDPQKVATQRPDWTDKA